MSLQGAAVRSVRLTGGTGSLPRPGPLGTGELPYTLKGQLSVTTPIGPQQVALTHQGRAPLSRIGPLIQPSIGR